MRRVRPYLILAVFVAIPAVAHADDQYTLEGRTSSFFAPTGETVGKNKWQLSLEDFGVGNVEYGLTDRVDLYASAPVIPLVVEVGTRVAILGGKSPLKLTAQGGIMSLTFDTGGQYTAIFDVGATLAYATPTFNLHSSIYYWGTSTMASPEQGVGVISVGVTAMVGKTTALALDVTQLGARGDLFGEWADSHVSFGHLVSGGVKLLVGRTDVELGGVAIIDADGQVTGAPIVNFTWRN